MKEQTNWLEAERIEKILSSGFPESMVILDCETTGGKSSYHRMIEVGLLIIENGKVTKRWQSFINPETTLPPFITKITGIYAKDLVDAPIFADIADELLEIIEGKILVAHNARFDYGFLRNEFSRIGTKYTAKLLCSVKFSRAMYPQFKRHSLDAIIKRFKLNIENRHRAQDDAEMVWQMFQKSTQLFTDDDIEATCEKILKTPTLPSNLDPIEIKKLPSSAGVYYFYDDKGLLLYVGKSVNIRNRVLNHFSQDHKNHKDLKMSTRIAHIDFKQTPSDFGAQLLESKQIKTLKPIMNTRLRKQKKLYQLKLVVSEAGYLTPSIVGVETEMANQQSSEQFGLFRSPRHITKKLEKIADQFFLCHRLLGLEPGKVSKNKPCFRYQLKRCLGACCEKETADEYNERIGIAFKEYQSKAWPWGGAIIVVEKDISIDMDSIESFESSQHYHLIDNWVYLGRLTSPDDIQDYGYEVSDIAEASQATIMTARALSNSKAENKDAPKNTFLNDRESQIEGFDLDMYFILVRFLFDPEKRRLNQLKIIKLDEHTEE